VTWPKIVLIAWLALSVLMTIATIGKPRKTMTPDVAVAVVIIDAILVALVVAS